MDIKQHWKRGNEKYIGIPTLIHILQKSQRKNKSSEREIQKGILVAYIHGYIPVGRDIILPMISYKKYNIKRRHIDRGS
jgi:hypothetical protein